MLTLPALGASIWFIVKIFFLIAIFVYIVFAGVIVRQVGLMIETLEVGFETPIKIFAWGHFLFAIGVLILAILIL